MMALFLLSAVLFVASSLVLLATRQKWQTIEEIKFDTSAYDSDPLVIRGLLVKPRTCRSQKLPGIVFCHGLIANKEIYLGLCRRIAKLGIAVLAIDLRGHGHSDGPSDFGKSEHFDVWAALDVLREREDIDEERLGIIGHSLGGIVTTRAAFLHPPERVCTAIAIFCWKGLGESIEAVFGPLGRFVGRWWAFFGWSRQFSITDEVALGERSVFEHLGPEVPVNYLLVVGSRDPLTDMKRSQEIAARAAGRSAIEAGVGYGSFAEISARELVVVKGANHFSILSKRKTFQALEEWLCKSFEMEESLVLVKSSVPRALGAVRMVAVLMFALSIVTCAGWLLGLGGTGPHSVDILSPSSGSSGVVVVAFLLCSTLAIPLARRLGLRPFVSHWGADVVSLIMASRSMLFVPVLLLMMVWQVKGGNLSLELMGLTASDAFSGTMIATVLFGWLVCSWNLWARTNWHTTFWPVVGVPTFLRLLALLFIIYFAEESLFRGVIQNQLSGLRPVFQILVSALLYSLVAATAITAALWPLFPSPFYSVRFRSLSIKLLPVVFLFGVGIFSLHGVLAALLFHFTHTIVAPALFTALLVSFVFSGSVGVRTS